MAQSPSWEADWFCSQSRNSPHFIEPESSLPYSQMPATCPYPEPILSCKKIRSILKCLWMKNFKTFKHCTRHKCIPCFILVPLHNCLYIFYFHCYILFSIFEGSTCCAANLTAWALILLVADVLVISFNSCNSTQQQFMLVFAISRNEAWCKQIIWGFCSDWSDEWIFTKCILWYYNPLNYLCK